MANCRGLDLNDGDETPLIEHASCRVSRGEMKVRADSLLATLKSKSVQRALVCSDDPTHILRAIDACNRAKTELFIAHTNLPKAQVESILEEFKIELWIGEEDQFRSVEPVIGSTACICLMTSGTTGRPKIVRHDLDKLIARIRASDRFPTKRGGKWLLTYQPTGFAGIQVQLTAVATSGIIVAPIQRTPAGFYEAAKRAGVAHISATPTFWRSFLMVAESGFLDLRQATLGGEAADQPTLDRLKKHFPKARVTHIYASTEAGVVFAVNDGRAGFPVAWLERPIQGVELRIRNGFLQIRTPNAMHGYVGGLPQPQSDDGWLATADLCKIEGDRVRILGRKDSTINVGGSKVYPLTVETFLLSQDGVAEARVYGVNSPISGQLVAADIVLRSEHDPATARRRILAACREGLADYQVPRAFKIVDTIVTGPSGKKG